MLEHQAYGHDALQVRGHEIMAHALAAQLAHGAHHIVVGEPLQPVQYFPGLHIGHGLDIEGENGVGHGAAPA